MVVVETEHEADVVDAGVAVGGDDDRAVGALHGAHALEPAVDADRRAVGAVDDDAARIARVAPGETKRVGAATGGARHGRARAESTVTLRRC